MIKFTKKYQWDLKKRHSMAFIVNFEHIQHINTLFNIDMRRNYTG